MLSTWHLYVSFLGGALVFSIGFLIYGRHWVAKRNEDLESEAEERDELTHIKLDKARERLEAEFEEYKMQYREEMAKMRKSIEKRELAISEANSDIENKLASLEDNALESERMQGELRRRQSNLENLRQLYRKRLQQISGIDKEQAFRLAQEEAKLECESEIRALRKELLNKSVEEVRAEARRILMDTMQRVANVPSSGVTAALVKLPSDDIKGRLIGKEGRNIKSFETVTGTTLVIDEAPKSVLVSSFDPVRREIGAVALKALIEDGRIHPASIEETVRKVEEKIQDEIIVFGEKALERLNLFGVSMEVVKVVGKLHYRLSNNQNTLDHSIEVGLICSMLAAELGLDTDIAKRCGLFHDLGKAISTDTEHSHAMAAAMLLKKHGECDEVVNAVAASHEEIPADSVYAELLKIADFISATRPGARCDSMEGYLQRIKTLEDLVSSFQGVQDSYAIQAGREVRVIVEPDMYRDDEAFLLAGKIRNRIENELNYPEKIKVTVIREQRYVETTQSMKC